MEGKTEVGLMGKLTQEEFAEGTNWQTPPLLYMSPLMASHQSQQSSRQPHVFHGTRCALCPTLLSSDPSQFTMSHCHKFTHTLFHIE